MREGRRRMRNRRKQSSSTINDIPLFPFPSPTVVFESGYHGAVEYEEWKNKKVGRITISPVLALHKTITSGNALLSHANKRRRDE